MKLGSSFCRAIRGLLVLLGVLLVGNAFAAEELVFYTQDFPPFTYLKDDAVAGPANDVIQAVCKKMNQACKTRLVSWTRAQQDVKEGKAHAIFIVGWNEDRAGWLYFSLPILDSNYGFFVHSHTPIKFTDLSQLKDSSVAVYGPSNTSSTLEKLKDKVPGMTVYMSFSDDAAFRKLSIDRVKAVYSNKAVGLARIKLMGLKDIQYAGLETKLKYHIGFSQARVSKTLVDRFDENYRELYRSGEISKILKSYQLEPVPLE